MTPGRTEVTIEEFVHEIVDMAKTGTMTFQEIAQFMVDNYTLITHAEAIVRDTVVLPT